MTNRQMHAGQKCVGKSLSLQPSIAYTSLINYLLFVMLVHYS